MTHLDNEIVRGIDRYDDQYDNTVRFGGSQFAVDVEVLETGEWRPLHLTMVLAAPADGGVWASAEVAIGDILEVCANCPDWEVTRKAMLALSACESADDAIDVQNGTILLPEVEAWLIASGEELNDAWVESAQDDARRAERGVA